MVALQVHYKPDDDGIYRYPYGSDLGPTDRMDFVDGYKQLISNRLINHFYDDASRGYDYYSALFEQVKSTSAVDPKESLYLKDYSNYLRVLRQLRS